MSNKAQAYTMFMEFIAARKFTPWVANWFQQLAEADDCNMGPRRCIERMGGMAAVW